MAFAFDGTNGDKRNKERTRKVVKFFFSNRVSEL
jgi:hypothetical protein